MRKNRIVLLLLLLFLGGALFNACLREELEAPPEEPKSSEMEKMLKGIKNPNVREAIEWYCANGPGGASARGMVAEHPLFEQMVPSWSYAFVRFSKAGGMTVEVPLGAYARTMNTLPENAIAYEETKNSMYLRSVTRLVILKDKASGCTRGFFMTLVPSRKYMDKRNFNVYRSTYFQREREFDGDIYFHELDGRFSNGWRYSDGKITHSIHAGKSSSLSRSGGYWIEVTNCYPKYRYVCVGHYVPTESGSVYVEDHCYNEYVGEECYTEQVWVPGEDPGGEYDPKKKCPYGTRGCPGGENCTCCKICEGPCVALPCPGCGERHCTKIHIDCDSQDDACKATTNELFDNIGSAEIFGDSTITYGDFLRKVSEQSSKEHSISLRKEWDSNRNKQVNTLAYYRMGTSGNVPMIYDKYTHAVIHTHPNSTVPGTTTILPPSAQDVFNLMSVVVKEETKSDGTTGYKFPNFKTSYVLAEGYTFAITVTDRKKAAQFLKNNPNFVGSDAGFVRGTNVGDAYGTAQNKLATKYSGAELDAYALAYALQKSDAGVQLLWKKDGEQVFTVLKARDASSEVIYVYHCK